MISFVFYYFCERKPYLCTLFTCPLYIYNMYRSYFYIQKEGCFLAMPSDWENIH